MSHWKTEEIKNLIVVATKFFSVKVITTDTAGDVDTEGIVVEMDEDTLWIRGFTLVDYTLKRDPSDMDIEAIEVTDGLTSGGGLNSEHLNTSVVYAHIVSILRQNGHSVVPTMNDYF